MLRVDNSGGVIRDNFAGGGKKVIIGAFTDKGKTREVNEDNYFVSEFDNVSGNGYCIIADGMGGHNAGEVASKIAIEVIKENIQRNYRKEAGDAEIFELLKKSMQMANEVIYKESLKNDTQSGMGTTAILCLVHHSQLYIAHVGDSRVYMVQNGTISQITTDHSIVEELINSGSITREEADNHPQKNVITRALGGEEHTEIDIYVQPLQDSDIILICTDGLTNMLSDSEILREIETYQDLQKVVEKLVRMANDKGGYDNITVVALKFQG